MELIKTIFPCLSGRIEGAKIIRDKAYKKAGIEKNIEYSDKIKFQKSENKKLKSEIEKLKNNFEKQIKAEQERFDRRFQDAVSQLKKREQLASNIVSEATAQIESAGDMETELFRQVKIINERVEDIDSGIIGIVDMGVKLKRKMGQLTDRTIFQQYPELEENANESENRGDKEIQEIEVGNR